MTASGSCAVCGLIATDFIYNTPRKDPNNINDGDWYCDKHCPVFSNITSHVTLPDDSLKGYSRRDRRALARKMVKQKGLK